MPESAQTGGRRQKNLVLILAREFASKLATPMLVADAQGNLVFYNEPAEEVLGRSFAEVGEMPADRWGDLFSVEDLGGEPMPLERMPGGIALLERRPAYDRIWITGMDAVRRLISVTAFPLWSSETELVGFVTVFWESRDAEAESR
jgi:PAS domain-containing protein